MKKFSERIATIIGNFALNDNKTTMEDMGCLLDIAVEIDNAIAKIEDIDIDNLENSNNGWDEYIEGFKEGAKQAIRKALKLLKGE